MAGSFHLTIPHLPSSSSSFSSFFPGLLTCESERGTGNNGVGEREKRTYKKIKSAREENGRLPGEEKRRDAYKEKEKRERERERERKAEGRGKVRERKQQVSPVARRKSIPNYAPALGAKRDKKRVDYIFV